MIFTIFYFTAIGDREALVRGYYFLDSLNVTFLRERQQAPRPHELCLKHQ